MDQVNKYAVEDTNIEIHDIVCWISRNDLNKNMRQIVTGVVKYIEHEHEGDFAYIQMFTHNGVSRKSGLTRMSFKSLIIREKHNV